CVHSSVVDQPWHIDRKLSQTPAGDPCGFGIADLVCLHPNDVDPVVSCRPLNAIRWIQGISCRARCSISGSIERLQLGETIITIRTGDAHITIVNREGANSYVIRIRYREQLWAARVCDV